MAKDNTLLLLALGGAVIYFWYKGQFADVAPAPVAQAVADASPTVVVQPAPTPPGYRLPPPMRKPVLPKRDPYQSPPWAPMPIACGNTVGAPCMTPAPEPVIDWYRPETRSTL